MDKESAKKVIHNLCERRLRILSELRAIEDDISSMAGDHMLSVDYQSCEAT